MPKTGGLFDSAMSKRQRGSDQLKANVQFVRFDTPRIQFEEENPHTHRVRFFESDDQENAVGVVLSFRNESQPKGVAEARYVQTQIIYMDKNGEEVGHGILGGSWMNDSGDSINIPVGKTQRALIGIIGTDGEGYSTWVERRDLLLSTEFYPWPAGTTTLEVRLIDEHDEWLMSPIQVDITISDCEPSVVIRKQ